MKRDVSENFVFPAPISIGVESLTRLEAGSSVAEESIAIKVKNLDSVAMW